jgi:hypothetical protein
MPFGQGLPSLRVPSLAIYNLKVYYGKKKKNYGKLKYFTMQKYHLFPKSSYKNK